MIRSIKHSICAFLLLWVWSCGSNNDNETPDTPEETETTFISAVDISSLPEILEANTIFYNLDNEATNALTLLKDSGVNTIRLRLWVNPENGHSGFSEVQQFATTLKTYGFKIWLTVHYSDTWADPAQQSIPAAWENDNMAALITHVQDYTTQIMTDIAPDFIQIGNEINSGFMHPMGNINTNPSQFITQMETAISVVRIVKPNTKIIVHYAGIEGAEWFYNQINMLDYDMIGLSYYPIWHGKSFTDLENTINTVATTHNKQVVIAETAYPFTLGWNDWTNNIVGLDEHLILPDYPATPTGQKDFVNAIKNLMLNNSNGIGFCYWGAELVAWKGTEATDGSSWENQALFDFDNKALPVIETFAVD
ncbi:glycoside hydrolase family 53 protein [Neptunitalea lumnitzerae]|uniref:Arabinogalactan endo-beta-1,4-galactanase n=1 Tax=Neptunitalea lumnitzerae TaxID=2965509 RepID=A0ABQ5MES4_9FLAO|nr:glycosyl hydrolase 53 family protein [Neptunitalea sp. Y10]GLB47890.1 hypothetical protein Y10_02580 [Neptunitalea sp. Y10]